jgi:hypothetical protein
MLCTVPSSQRVHMEIHTDRGIFRLVNTYQGTFGSVANYTASQLVWIYASGEDMLQVRSQRSSSTGTMTCQVDSSGYLEDN